MPQHGVRGRVEESTGGEGAASPSVPEPTPFGPGDVVPRFRTDLHVQRGATPALFDVSDPLSGRKFTLYEFELAVARMLDGRRKVSEVVESGARLGIPLDAGALYKFVRQMWHYGFLSAPGAGTVLGEHGVGEGGTWEDREPWDEATRSLFQTGQRLMRLGRNADAAGYFEAVLDAHPANPEATEMLALIARGHSLAATTLGESRAEVVPAAPRQAPRRRRSLAVLVAGVALAVAALGVIALLVPPGTPEQRASAPAAPAPATDPRPPPPAEALPAPPAPPAWRTAPVERRSHPPVAELLAPSEGEVAWTAAADAPVAKGQQVAVLRVVVAAGRKDAALVKRVAELERLASHDPVYRDFLEKARRDLRKAAARRRTRPVPLVAPAAGILARAPEGAGAAAAGERLARVLDAARWQLAVTVDGSEPAADAACEVVGDVQSDRAACRIVARVRAGDRLELLVEVPAASAPWVARAASPWVRIAPGAAAPPAAAAPGTGENRTP